MAHLPPISALRALEAAARHLSFTKAADELNVTQSAVSHQIKHLEELWDLKLFQRLTRRLELTTSGKALAPVIQDFFHKLEGTLDELKSDDGHSILRIQMMPSVAAKWVVPRLQGFRDRHPDIDVWISTLDPTEGRFEFRQLDAALHLGTGEYPNLTSWPAMREYVFPVARPRFLEERGIPQSPADLCQYPLLLRTGSIGAPQWEYWFDQVGVDRSIYEPALHEGTRFPDSNMALQAAFDGQGIALARSAPVWDDVQSGRLVRLFNVSCPFPLGIYFVCPTERAETPVVIAFREWLMEEAAISQAEFDAAETTPVGSLTD